MNDETLRRIVSAVSQAVLASINGAGSTHTPPPRSATATTELVEVPMVGSGSDQVVDPVSAFAPVASTLHHVTGETNFIQVSPSSQQVLPTFHSADVPIDDNVSPKIKTKIWAHKFIDFGILLSSGTGDTRYHLSVSTDKSAHGSSLLLCQLNHQISRKPYLPHIAAWTSAFQIFVGVYTAKFPLDAPALMKYCEVVRDLAARGADWRFHDTQFRLLRHSNPVEFPWESTHWELWIRAQNFNNARFNKGPSASAQQFVSWRTLSSQGFLS